MANLQKYIPLLLEVESQYLPMSHGIEHAFTKLRDALPRESKEVSVFGITLDMYKRYCKAYHISEPVTENLCNIPYGTWCNVMREEVWEMLGMDGVLNQSIAMMICDWFLCDGEQALDVVAELLGFRGERYGRRMVAHINSVPQVGFFVTIKKARMNAVQDSHYLVRRRVCKRLNKFEYSEC